jgi:hypothetical protein
VRQIRLGWKIGKDYGPTRHGDPEKAATAAIAKVKREHEPGIVPSGQRITVESFLGLCIQRSVENTVQPQLLRS